MVMLTRLQALERVKSHLAVVTASGCLSSRVVVDSVFDASSTSSHKAEY